MRTCALLASFLTVLLFTASFAEAEDGAPENDITKEIKAQMEEILRLMKANEDALLALSSGESGDPKAVDVKVPLPPEQKGKTPPPEGTPPSGGEGTSGEGAKGEAGTTGRKAARKIEELLGAQQSGSKRIPGEIEKLLKMIPT